MKPLTAPSYDEEASSFPSLGIGQISSTEPIWTVFTKKETKAWKLAYRLRFRRLQNFVTSRVMIGIVSIVMCVIWLAMIITTVFFV